MACPPKTVGTLCALCLLACQLKLADGKRQAGSIKLGGPAEEQRWQFLSKFAYAVGKGTFDIRVRLQKPLAGDSAKLQPRLEVYLDEHWPRVESLAPCRRESEGPARYSSADGVSVGAPGVWGPWYSGSLNQNLRSHIWYFALSTCGEEGTEAVLDYELQMRQFDGGELSSEARLLPGANMMGALALALLLAHFAQRCHHQRKCIGAMHPVIVGLGVALVLQFLGQLLHVLHLRTYVATGVGAPAVDFLAEALSMLSQVVTATLLLAIAQGYTLVRADVGELGPVVPVAAVVAVLHVVLLGLGRLQGEAASSHHSHEGLVGLALLAVRLLLHAWFLAGVRLLKSRGGLKMQSFLGPFTLAASAYFLAYPALFVLVQIVAPYLRVPVLQLGLLGTQSCCSIWLAVLFFSKGAYYEVSALGSSLLPGAGAGEMFSGSRGKFE